MLIEDDFFRIVLANSETDVLGAQRLRYRVFVEEMGARGALVDHAARFERDRFDEYFQHLVLIDKTRDPARLDHVVGAYRLMNSDRARDAGGYYSEGEYNLEVLKSSGYRLLELGRSCLEPSYRRGTALAKLWLGLSAYVDEHDIDLLFGVASFPGTDPMALAQPLSYLHHNHMSPRSLRVRAQAGSYRRMDLIDRAALDPIVALQRIPALIKAYLRAGATVGDGAFVDTEFGTTDVCVILDTHRMNRSHRMRYQKAVA